MRVYIDVAPKLSTDSPEAASTHAPAHQDAAALDAAASVFSALVEGQLPPSLLKITERLRALLKAARKAKEDSFAKLAVFSTSSPSKAEEGEAMIKDFKPSSPVVVAVAPRPQGWLDWWPLRCTRNLMWDLVRFAIGLHAIWILGWVLMVGLNGRASPRCSGKCTMAARGKEKLFWHTPEALFIYVILFVLLIVVAYTMASRRWLRSKQPLLQWLLRLVLIVSATPIFLNFAFWKPVLHYYGTPHYIDWDPASARTLDASYSLPPTLPIANGTDVALRVDDAVLVGNGPLSAEQRAFLRHTHPTQIYRFNGMTNLLPDEPVGHVFVRRIVGVALDVVQFPGEYWGLAPPIGTTGFGVELCSLMVPRCNTLRERSMCHRTREAVGITLLNGNPDDALYYTQMYGVRCRLPECDGLCKEAPPGAKGAISGWTSGFLGLLEVLETQPSARVHLLGMNFGDAPNKQHATHVERRLVEMLVQQERVLLHVSPSSLYHSEFTSGTHDHLAFPTNLHLHDQRIQSMRCGEWTTWWFPEWQWSPESFWHGWLPLPPYFHSGTEFKPSDFKLPSNYDPFNCTQHGEILENRRASTAVIGGSAGEGRRLKAELNATGRTAPRRRSWRLPRLHLPHIRRGAGIYGGSLHANASEVMESVEECEQRAALIRKYDVFASLATHGGGMGSGEGGERGAAAQSAQPGAEASSSDAGTRGGSVRSAHWHVHGGGGAAAPYVNTSKFEADGYVIVDNVFSPEHIDAIRERVLWLKMNESSQFKPWYIPSAADPGSTIPNFMARPTFSFMHGLPSHPALHKVLKTVFGGSRYRYCSHNDIGIDRIVGWHKDVLNDKYKHYQSLPLWQDKPPEGGHFIVKTLIYLEDHKADSDALILVPGSHRTPSYQTHGSVTLHPKKGSVVVFEQRATHRGRDWRPSRYFDRTPPRILVSLGYGRDNIFTHQFEKGTRARQADQCGSRCVVEAHEPAHDAHAFSNRRSQKK